VVGLLARQPALLADDELHHLLQHGKAERREADLQVGEEQRRQAHRASLGIALAGRGLDALCPEGRHEAARVSSGGRAIAAG